MGTHKCKLLTTLVALCLLSACDSGLNAKDPKNYFPLNKGLVWEYKHHTELTGKDSKLSTMKIESLGNKEFQDQNYSVRRTSNGTDYYLKEDDTGIFRYGVRTIVENYPRLDAAPKMVMPLPIPDKVGKSWSEITQSYTLHRVLPNYEPPNENIARFYMTYTLVGIDEEISVPAGTYKHCLLIEGQALIDKLSGTNPGSSEIEITTREWYAPGVGLVKMERLEPLDGSVFKGGKITMELERVSGF